MTQYAFEAFVDQIIFHSHHPLVQYGMRKILQKAHMKVNLFVDQHL